MSRQFLQVNVPKTNNWRYVVHVYTDDIAHSPQRPVPCFLDKEQYVRAMLPHYTIRIAADLSE